MQQDLFNILQNIKCLINNTKDISIDMVINLEEEYSFLAEDHFDSVLKFIGITNHWCEPCDYSSNDLYTYYEFDILQTYADLWEKVDLLKSTIPSTILDRLEKINERYANKYINFCTIEFPWCTLDSYHDNNGKAKGLVFWSEWYPVDTISALVFLIIFIDYLKTLIPILKSVLRKTKKAA